MPRLIPVAPRQVVATKGTSSRTSALIFRTVPAACRGGEYLYFQIALNVRSIVAGAADAAGVSSQR